MASRSSRRKLERITYEDLISSSGMSGFDALVRTNPADIQAALERNPEFNPKPLENTTGVKLTMVTPTSMTADAPESIPKSTGDNLTPANLPGVALQPVAVLPTECGDLGPDNLRCVAIGRREPGGSDTGDFLTRGNLTGDKLTRDELSSPPAFLLPEVHTGWQTEDGRPIRAGQKIHRIVRAQDALTHTEESLYDILWGQRNQNGDRVRLVTAGYAQLAQQARIAPKNVKLTMRQLIQKGFVEIEVLGNSIETRQATQYRVFSYAAALERMRDRNRTHIVRITSSIHFAIPVDLDPTSTMVKLTMDVRERTTVNLTPVESKATGVNLGSSTGVNLNPLSKETFTSDTTTSEVRQIAQALRQSIGAADDDVARRLIAECRKRAADATVAEISEFVQQKAGFAMRNPQIRNPSGFLITAVPLCFEGESFQIFRKSREQAKRQERAEMQRIAMTILDAPESSDEDRNWARSILGNTRD